MTKIANPEAPFVEIAYERPEPGVARILMNRPDRANAQGVAMTYELDRAFQRACRDPEVHVIILAGAGKHFNGGHDLGGRGQPDPREGRSLWGEFDGPGWAGSYAREREIYLDITERWRNAPKPTIAEVQGACIAGGLMLAWACDLIICSDDARFRDNTAADMAIPGVEFFHHPMVMNVRKAKEWLLTGDWMDAETALAVGMVNHVVPRAELPDFTLGVARKIAATNPFTARLVKEAMNQAQDAMGRRAAMSAAFSLHQMGHMQSLLTNGLPIDPSKLPASVREKLPRRG
ncbi:enoyl-CoA hydratase [Phenylobacterium sp.]|uniref:enoyl-CoA hydratase n=1 Tax=Phenylobacterium sp. TaxID=1871053 RepID=UPI00301D1F49